MERFLSVLALASALTKETDNQWKGKTDFGLYRLPARLHVAAPRLTYRGLCGPTRRTCSGLPAAYQPGASAASGCVACAPGARARKSTELKPSLRLRRGARRRADKPRGLPKPELAPAG